MAIELKVGVLIFNGIHLIRCVCPAEVAPHRAHLLGEVAFSLSSTLVEEKSRERRFRSLVKLAMSIRVVKGEGVIVVSSRAIANSRCINRRFQEGSLHP